MKSKFTKTVQVIKCKFYKLKFLRIRISLDTCLNKWIVPNISYIRKILICFATLYLTIKNPKCEFLNWISNICKKILLLIILGTSGNNRALNKLDRLMRIRITLLTSEVRKKQFQYIIFLGISIIFHLLLTIIFPIQLKTYRTIFEYFCLSSSK